MNINRHRNWIFAASLMLAILTASGCKENARLADHDVRAREVQTVEAYGHVLDQTASPGDVVYVFLKAVLDDYDAGNDSVKRELAFDTQLGTLATATIKKKLARNSQNERQVLESFFMAARRFAPVVGHYRETFREDYESLTARMLSTGSGSTDGSASIVRMNLDHPDPEQRPQGNVVARFDMVRENGYWRIWWVSFESATRDWKKEKLNGRPLSEIARQKSGTAKP
ncbi:MAG: hypothetical protein DHS20C16_10950 [Phycisphaerae bacterium]|nr:MAG: hypothetical protein DHS20C16_10950 [Phycisphaerae bacterium]